MYYREKIDELIKTHASFEACKQPYLPVDSPEIMKFVKDVKPIDCSSAGFNWVLCEVSVNIHSSSDLSERSKSLYMYNNNHIRTAFSHTLI